MEDNRGLQSSVGVGDIVAKEDIESLKIIEKDGMK